MQPTVWIDDLSVQQLANRALDRCAADASTWTVHDIQEHVTRIITEVGVRAEPAALHDMVAMTTRLAAEDCLSVLPPGSLRPEHVANLTLVHVVAVETRLRDLLATRASAIARAAPDVASMVRRRGLDPEQAQAAAAVAATDPLVVVEGAAGAGKTTMLAVAIEAAAATGRPTRMVTPTRRLPTSPTRNSVSPAAVWGSWFTSMDGSGTVTEYGLGAPPVTSIRRRVRSTPACRKCAAPARRAGRGGRGRDARPGHRPRPPHRRA